jgi:hypothetical protein
LDDALDGVKEIGDRMEQGILTCFAEDGHLKRCKIGLKTQKKQKRKKRNAYKARSYIKWEAYSNGDPRGSVPRRKDLASRDEGCR